MKKNTIAVLISTALTLVASASMAADAKHDFKTKKDWKAKKVEPVEVIADVAATPSDYYFTVGAGVSFNKNKFTETEFSHKKSKSAAQFTAGFGKNMCDRTRADFTLSLTPAVSSEATMKNGKLKSDVGSLTAMVNGYYHLTDSSSSMSPYGTMGLGLSRNTMDGVEYTPNAGSKTTYNYDKTKTSFAWQIGAGISGKLLNTGAIWDLGYRYADKGEVSKGNDAIRADLPNFKTKLKTHSFIASIRLPM